MDTFNSATNSVEPQRLPDLKPSKHETTTVTLRKSELVKPDVLARLVGGRNKSNVYTRLANLGVENPKALFIAVPQSAIESMFLNNQEIRAQMPMLARVRFNVQSLNVLDDALQFSGDLGLEEDGGQKQTARYTAEIHVDRTFHLVSLEVASPTLDREVDGLRILTEADAGSETQEAEVDAGGEVEEADEDDEDEV